MAFCFVSSELIYANEESFELAPQMLTIFQDNDQKVTYDESTDRYHFKADNQHISTPRYNKEEFKDKVRPFIEESEWGNLSSRINEHYTWQRAARPSSEEAVSEAFATRDFAMGIIEHGQSFPCNNMPGLNKSLKGPNHYQLNIRDEAANKIDDMATLQFVERRSFMGLGELTGLDIEFTLQNDNPLLGGLMAIGVTEHAEGIEGDDRGKTMGLNLGTTFVFDEGSVTIRKSVEGHGRLKPRVRTETKPSTPAKTLMIGNQNYVTEYRESRDEDGKYYQEFLSIDGLELEVRRDLDNEIFVRVIGKREVFDDEGLAAKIQEKWHKELSKYTDSAAQYNNQEHRNRDVRYSAKLQIGKEITLRQTDNYILTSNLAGSVQAANRRSGREVGLRGELRLRSSDGQGPDNKYPTWDAKVYVDGRVDQNEEESIYTGAEIQRRFSLSKKDDKFISVAAGASYEDDPLSREFSSEELKDNDGRFDLQYNLRIKYEQLF
jgi:hypothetical protein